MGSRYDIVMLSPVIKQKDKHNTCKIELNKGESEFHKQQRYFDISMLDRRKLTPQQKPIRCVQIQRHESIVPKGTKPVAPCSSKPWRTFRIIFSFFHMVKALCKIRTLLSSNLQRRSKKRTMSERFIQDSISINSIQQMISNMQIGEGS